LTNENHQKKANFVLMMMIGQLGIQMRLSFNTGSDQMITKLVNI